MPIKRFSAVIISALWFAGAAHAATFMAGAGRADIDIPATVLPLEGFSRVHDPLSARTLLMDDGQKRIALVVIDQTSMGDDLVSDIKTVVQTATSVSPDDIIVVASHGFSSPHVFPPEHAVPETREKTALLKQAIEAAVDQAARQAEASLQPAHTGFGDGTSRVAVNRDVPTPAGWWLGGNSAGFTDPTLGVLRIDGDKGQPLAILMNLGVQSSVLDFSVDNQGNRVISSDLAGAATRAIEAKSGTTALFLIGAAGDQSPVLQANRHVVNADGSVTRTDIHEAGFALVDLLGERLAQDTLAASAFIKTDEPPRLALIRRSIEVVSQPGQPGGKPPSGPVSTYSFQPGDKVSVPIVLVRIGDTAIVGVREELSASTGAWIRQHSPFAHTLVVTMVDGAAKYMPEADAYDRITYEARSSRYAKGSAETLAAAVIDMLRNLQAAP